MVKAKDIMTKEVIRVKPSTAISELLKLLLDHKISGTPVVDDNDNIVGIVTESDLINQNKKLHIPTVIRIFDAFFIPNHMELEEEIKKMSATTVWEICNKKVIYVEEETPLDEIATIMAEKKVHLIPVVSDSKVVGIIGKYDIVRAVAGEG